MGKHQTDPVLQQLVHAINESEQAWVPVTVSAHGTLVSGVLISQRTYFAELAEGSPLLRALHPESGLLGKDYAKDIDTEAGHQLHIRADAGEGLWRISLESVDGWTLGRPTAAAADEKGPFARLLGV